MAKRRTPRSFGEASSSPDQASCFLCKQQHTNYSSPSQWKSEDAQKYALTMNIPQDAVICKACRQDIPRILADSSNTPRRLKSPISKSDKMCAINKCPNVGFTTLQKTTFEKLSEVLQSLSLDLTASSITLPVSLCKSHYHMIYKVVNPIQRHAMYHLDI